MANRPVARLLGPRFIKRWLPRTLWGRSLLIIVLPVALMQVVLTWYFFNDHWANVTSQLSAGMVDEVVWILDEIDRDPSPAHVASLAARTESTFGLSIEFPDNAPLPTGTDRASRLASLDHSLRQSVESRIDRPFWFDTTRYNEQIDLRIDTGRGVLRVIAPRDRALATGGNAFLVWMVVATMLLLAVSILFIRNQVRSIERLAAAAEGFGRGEDVSAFKPHGAREVRQAALAFIDMKERISRHLEQRTALLASVSHDLRTPLTRLKLELALAEASPRIEAMGRDIAEMEHMIDEYLAFAKGEGGEAAETLPLAPLVGEVAEGARRAGAEVTIDVPATLTAKVRPNALKRALANLIGNAAVHGETVEIGAAATADAHVEITIDDDGPGIPAELREEAFKPFNRLDDARNQNRKGVGLGLAIARDVARAHGGDVLLSGSPLGGLRAIVRLPA